MSTYAERQAYRDSHPGAIVDNNSSSDGGFTSSTPNGTPSGGTPTSSNVGSTSTSAPAAPAGDAKSQLAAIQQSLLNAIGSGNKAAADQAAAQFAQTFGLDQQKFQESVKEYGQNYGLALAGVTGKNPDGTPTLAAQNDLFNQSVTAAGLSGYFQGKQTEAGRQFDVTAGQNSLNASNDTANKLLALAASLHSDPFRQLQVMYGAHGISGINNAVNGLTGQYGLPGAFTAPGAAGTDANGFPTGQTATLGGLAQSYQNAGSGLTPSQQAANTGLTNPNQIIARNYNSAPQNVKDFATSALSANNGLDQQANDAAIQKNLPQFKAPDFGLAAV